MRNPIPIVLLINSIVVVSLYAKEEPKNNNATQKKTIQKRDIKDPNDQRDLKDPSKTFGVATANINWGNVDLDQTIKVIRSAKADIVVLQETNPESEKHLTKNLKSEFPYSKFHIAEYSGGFGYLSKTPIKNYKLIKPKFGFFSSIAMETTIQGKPVQFANIHLEPVNPKGKKEFGELIKIFLSTENKRLNEITHVYKNLKKDIPTIIAGDFNSTSVFSAPAFMKQKGFVDSFAAVNKAPDMHITWRWKYAGKEWKFRIDYIFHSKELTTQSSKIIENKSSDHHVVVSKLVWNSGEEKEKKEPIKEQQK